MILPGNFEVSSTLSVPMFANIFQYPSFSQKHTYVFPTKTVQKTTTPNLAQLLNFFYDNDDFTKTCMFIFFFLHFYPELSYSPPSESVVFSIHKLRACHSFTKKHRVVIM